MKKSLLHLSIKLFFLFIIGSLNATELVPKDTIVSYAQKLHNEEAHQKLVDYGNSVLKTFKINSTVDSLVLAKLCYYQSKGNYSLGEYWKSINSSTKGIEFSPNTTEGIEYKGRLFADKAWPESKLTLTGRAIKSLKTGIDLLINLPKKGVGALDYTVNSYILLSSEYAYWGDLESAKLNLRLATKLYHQNKEALDKYKVDGNGERFEIVLLYRKMYLLYKLGSSKKDSVEIEATMQKLEKAHTSKSFKVQERVYYSTSLNHIGDWYLGYKPDSLITISDVKRAEYYIDKSIDFIRNKKYPGSYFSFMFNKCKALTKANKLTDASELINHLLDSVPVKAYKPFFLAQKGLIKAKAKNKKESLETFYKVIEYVHTGEEKLAKDYSNFKPSEIFGQTNLLSRVAEKLDLYYGDDPEVKRIVLRLYRLSLIQFKNSHGKAKFNKKENELLRKILNGVLVASSKQGDFDQDLLAEVLNSTENIMNKRAWEEFKQNRYTSALSNLDSITRRELDLKTALVFAQKEQDLNKVDSIQQQIYNHIAFTEKTYPNLSLVRDYNFDISKLQKRLSEKEMVIKYFFLFNKLAIFSITNNQIKCSLIPWDEKNKELVNEFAFRISERRTGDDLSQVLSKKILPEISQKIKSLIINPDGELYKIPFEILYRNNKLIISQFNVNYSSNLGFIDAEDLTDKLEEDIYVYAPDYEGKKLLLATRGEFSDLEGARKEAKLISDLFPSKVFTGLNVSKEVFVNTASKASYLHLAMHAKINENSPGLSRFIFGKNSKVEEDLYLDELYALNLKANLAVLSACNTATGKESAGRGIESFQRAFSFAGVSSTVASLWEVPDDATSQIMEGFYKELKKGLPKSKALQNAKLNYLEIHQDTKLADPYYWAGFVLYGNNEAISKGSQTNLFVWLGIVLLIALVGFLIRKRVKA
jgi:LPXTG-motif cell wall-anchored protein